MDEFYNEVTRGRKRACKRSRQNKTEQEVITPKKRTRQRRDTLTRDEIDSLSFFAEDTSEIPNAFSKLTTQTTSEVTQPSYSVRLPLSAFKPMMRSAEMPNPSSAYPTHSPFFHGTATTTMSEMTRAPEIPQASSSYSMQPPPYVPTTTATMTSSAVGMAPSSGYAAQTQPPEIPRYHTMAERTRAATKMLRNRMGYAAQLTATSPSALTSTETAATTVASAASKPSTQMQHPEMADSYYLRQRHQTSQGVRECNRSIPTSQAMDKYWFKNNTTVSITPKSPAHATNRQGKTVKSELVQTDLAITPMEGKLLKVIRTKQLEPSNLSISIDEDDYTIIYKQVQEKKRKPKPIETIMRSSDIIKTSLMKFYSNTLPQSAVPEMPIDNTNNERHFQEDPKTSSSDFVQNLERNENSQLFQSLMGTPKTNDECKRATSNTNHSQFEINQPRADLPREQSYQIPTTGQHRHYTNYTNPRYYNQHHYRFRGPQPRPIPGVYNPQLYSEFFRYAPFIDPRFLPYVVGQTFTQFRMPGWF